jgi:hypothetical protein
MDRNHRSRRRCTASRTGWRTRVRRVRRDSEGDRYCRARSSGRRRPVDERVSSWCEASGVDRAVATVGCMDRARLRSAAGRAAACRRQTDLRRVARGGTPDRYGAPGARDRDGSRRSPISGDRRAGRGGTWSFRHRCQPHPARTGRPWVRGPRGRPQPERRGHLRHAGRPGRVRRLAPSGDVALSSQTCSR